MRTRSARAWSATRAWSRARRSGHSVHLVPFVSERFQLRDRLEIAGAAGGPLRGDQPWKIEASATVAKQVDLDGMRQQIIVRAAARDIAEDIDVSDLGGEREVQPRAHRGDGPLEREAGRRAAKVWAMLAERADKPLDVLVGPFVDDVDVLCESGGPWTPAASPPTMMNRTCSALSAPSSRSKSVVTDAPACGPPAWPLPPGAGAP
jgi:hypothetical protein